MSHILSFDIGGTGIKYGVVTPDGKLIFHNQFPTPRPSAHQGDQLLNLLIEYTIQVMAQYKIAAIGISTHGVVNTEKGEVIFSSHHLPGLKNLPIKSNLEKEFKILVFLDNDVNSAAIGELWQGSAKKYQNFVFIALGTSIGGAIIVNRHLVRGRNHCGGEIGYLVTNEKADKDTSVLLSGAWECYASASALTKNYHLVKNNTSLSPDDFMIDLENNDPETCEVFNNFIFSLTSGMISLAHTLDPDAFILGGAIVNMKSKLFEPVIESYKQRALSICMDTPIVAASLGNTAGMIGIAYTTLRRMK
ncbi:MAG: glucokinase [Francisellaceae bacterium]|jgi:glucokinase